MDAHSIEIWPGPKSRNVNERFIYLAMMLLKCYDSDSRDLYWVLLATKA